ncbi:MAG: hypothetical protein KJO01_14165 [Gammaproteobacteria bacterium]|nr:hypothetical protein [Gammaproteobacteria bacterium]MBT8109229.1 hypothetical protein [Gammaproteobacteria bacterium]NND46217.1 hypothetical protein [Woeseiaceae bacterium]NNL43931.1 hypothetical protein [Woeseiaceae bacterium]
MEKLCGEIRLVGNLTGGELRTQVDQHGNQRFVGSFRTATQLDALQVGDTTLLNARLPGNIYDALATGRTACVYVFRTLLRKALILGVKYEDTGDKHLIGHSYYRGTLLQLATVHTLLNAIGCWILGMIVGAIIGLGQSAVPPLLGLVGGWAASWWQAYCFYTDFRRAQAD